jgi:hypothetical protein
MYCATTYWTAGERFVTRIDATQHVLWYVSVCVRSGSIDREYRSNKRAKAIDSGDKR